MELPNCQSSVRHIAVLAFPFGTHAGPLLTLVRWLSAAAPDVHFSFICTAGPNSSLFKDSHDQRIMPYNIDDGLPAGYVPGENPIEPVELFLEVARAEFMSGMEKATAAKGEKIGCLISDAFFWFAGDIARDMNVPWLPLWSSGPRPLLLHVETDLILQKIKSPGSGEEFLNFLPEFSEMRVADLPKEITCGKLESPFPKMLYEMGHCLPQANAVILNSVEEMEPRMLNVLSSKFKKLLNVGPLSILGPPSQSTDEHGCLQWLDTQEAKSVVYISFGGDLSPPRDELVELCEALEEGGFPYLWSFRGETAGKLSKGFLERANNRGKIVPWAPQVKVLKHGSVGVFITHGGWNSILESIAGGVPMICRPFRGDQPVNVWTVEHLWGIGLAIELEEGKVKKSGILKALEQILSSGKGKEMREKLRSLQNLACKAVETAGSSIQHLNSLVEILKQGNMDRTV